MLPQEIIRKKRDKQNLRAEEIDFFVRGVTDGTIADCQIGSFTMAAFLNGLDAGETKNLTLAMRDSGDVLQWPELDAPVVDKHSSGGVGDKVSLMLAPMLAAAGVYVTTIFSAQPSKKSAAPSSARPAAWRRPTKRSTPSATFPPRLNRFR